MVDELMIQRAVDAVLRAAPVGSTVILFGSYATGQARTDSDVDFLVVEPEVADCFGEMARLSSLLGKMLIPADVVVVSRETFERLREMPNTLPHRARREGKIYESVG